MSEPVSLQDKVKALFIEESIDDVLSCVQSALEDLGLNSVADHIRTARQQLELDEG